ncbi:unnamed protein product [Prunus armeniaca]
MMLLHVLGQGKRGYLTWKVAQVEKDALSFDSWGIEDSIVKGWLIKTRELDLCKATRNTQEGRDITSYFAELKTVWLKRDRRLDDEFDKIRGDFLRLSPLPKLEELFALVQKKAQYWETMLKNDGKTESSAKQRKAAHEKKKNGGSGVAVVVAVGQSSSARSLVLPQLSILEPADC